MATFQDFSLLKTKVDTAMKENDFPNIGYAFGYLYLQELYRDIDDVEEFITDGPGDLGIDAFVIDEEVKTVDIFQFKYTEDFEDHKGSRVKQGDLDKLNSRITQILNKNTEIISMANPEVARYIEMYWGLVSKDRFDIKIHFVTNLQDPITDDVKKLYVRSLKEYEIGIEFYDIRKITDLLLSDRVKKVDVKIQLSGKSYFEKNDGDIRCLTGSVNAYNFFKAILEEDSLNEELFDENVRVYLKDKTSINKEIKKTAQREDNYKFFYFNNGITVICEDIKYSPGSDSPVVQLAALQIVNGSQTVHTLYELFKDPNLKNKLNDIYFLVRIYQTLNKKLGQEVAQYTNAQNPVKGRDIFSNDLTQVKLQEELKMHDYYYARKKNEFSTLKKLDKEKIIDAEKAGQVILSFYLEKPGDAKNKKSEIYRKDYYQIFDDEKLSAPYVLLPMMLYRHVEDKIRVLKKEKRELVKQENHEKLQTFLKEKDFMLHSSYYLLFTLNCLSKVNKIKVDYSNLNKIKKLFDRAVEIMTEVLDEHKNEQPAKLLKANQLVKEIKTKLGIL